MILHTNEKEEIFKFIYITNAKNLEKKLVYKSAVKNEKLLISEGEKPIQAFPPLF